MSSPLAEWMPETDFNDHLTWDAKADVEQTAQAMRAFDPQATAILGFVARVRANVLRHLVGPPPAGSPLESLGPLGDAALAQGPHWLVLGFVGEIWRPGAPIGVVSDAGSFAACHGPGYARVAWHLSAEPRVGGGAQLVMRTGIDCVGDASVRQRVVAYWRVAAWPSRAVRLALLAAVAGRAAARKHADATVG